MKKCIAGKSSMADISAREWERIFKKRKDKVYAKWIKPYWKKTVSEGLEKDLAKTLNDR